MKHRLSRAGAIALAVIITCSLLAGVGRPEPAQAAGGHFFPETGHTLSGPLLTAWEAGGGLWVFGYPISEPFAWSNVDGEVVIAQYFERARLEYHPRYAGSSSRVLGGLLGDDYAAGRRSGPDFQPVGAESNSGCDYFDVTGHTLCGVFQQWWHAQGGLPVFGYPISESFNEGGFLVQYFERARLEYHPQYAGTQWEVELGHLGVWDAQRRQLLDTPPFQSVAASSVTLRVAATLYSEPAGGAPTASLPAGSVVSVVGGPSYDMYQVAAGGASGWVEAGALNWSVQDDPRDADQYTLSSLSPALAAQVAEIADKVSVGVYDPLLGRVYAGGDSGPVAAASLAKTLLLTIALRQAEQRGGDAFEGERDVLAQMIEFSDNDAANTIWNAIGGQQGVVAYLSENNIAGFDVPAIWDWGQIAATGPTWAVFLGLLGSGQLLSPADTAYALDLMYHVIDDHRWGVLTPGADRLSFGKNDWYPDEFDVFNWRVNSGGFIDSTEAPLGVAPLVVVVMTRYPGEWGMGWGVDVARQVADGVVATAEQRWQQAQHSADPAPEVGFTPRGALARMDARLYVARLRHLMVAGAVN